MEAFSLVIDDLVTLCGLLHGKRLVGLDEAPFRVFSEENLPRLKAGLRARGWIRPADRPDTWHFNEDLMQALAVAVAPRFAVLARAPAERRSIVFYIAGADVTEVIFTGDRVVVAALSGVGELSDEAAKFLRDARPAEIVVARVNSRTDGFDAGRRAEIDASGVLCRKDQGGVVVEETPFSPESVEAFVRGSLEALG